jgi:hypothetical protein
MHEMHEIPETGNRLPGACHRRLFVCFVYIVVMVFAGAAVLHRGGGKLTIGSGRELGYIGRSQGGRVMER